MCSNSVRLAGILMDGPAEVIWMSVVAKKQRRTWE